MAGLQKIVCPHCKTEISVDDALHSQIETSIRKKYEAEKRKDKDAVEAKERELAKKAEELEAAQKNTDKAVADAISGKMAELAKREEELESTKRNAELEIAKGVKEKLAQREQEIQKQAKLDAEDEVKQERETWKSREQDLTVKLAAARNEQLQLMDEKKKLQDNKEAFEIEKRKQLEKERHKIREDADEKAAERYKTELATRDKALADASRDMEEMKRRIEQGSQQTQGEVAELNLEEALSAVFIHDVIEPVPKGIRGADIIQKVRNAAGKDCGQIVWEVKNTKTWSEGWIQKLKNDQREIHADVAIIISKALPDDVKAFAPRDGVWVCSMNLAIPLARIIRDKLEAIAREKGLAVGKNDKMEILYQYLTGVQFKQRIEAIVKAFSILGGDIEKEKRYFAKKWATQEKQIEMVMAQTIGVYGDIDGMVSLPKIPTLELEYHASDDGAGELVEVK